MTIFKYSKIPTPQTYHEVLKTNGEMSAVIVCPKGHPMSILDHKIQPDGIVTPSVVGPHVACENCDFHDFIKLDGWAW